MHRPTGPGPTGRLLIFVLSIALLTGLTGLSGLSATVATAADAAPLPACQVTDTLTRYRTLADWRRALLDQQYRLSSTHKPKDPPLDRGRRPQRRLQGAPSRRH